jgi:hypothetical protein
VGEVIETGGVIELSLIIGWAIGAVIAFGAAFIALRYFKLSPLWALIIGMVIFTGIQFPFPLYTTAARVEVPKN